MPGDVSQILRRHFPDGRAPEGLDGFVADVNAALTGAPPEPGRAMRVEARLREVLESVRVIALLLDGRGRVAYANGFFRALAGCGDEKLDGVDWFETFVPPDRREPARATFAQCLGRGEARASSQEEIVTRDGVRRTIAWHATVLRNAAGEVEAVASVGIDVTDSRRAEVALRESEQRLLLHVQRTPLAVVEFDADGRMSAWNAAAERIFGWTAEEAIGRSAGLLVAGPHRLALKAMWLRLLASAEGARVSVENRTKFGDSISCDWFLTRLVDAGGRAIGVAALALDVTEQRRAEDALRVSEERYALAMRGANDGLWDWNLATGHAYYSNRWLAMVGLDVARARPTPDEWFERVHPDDLARLRAEIDRHVEGETPHFEHEHRMRRVDGTWMWVLSRGLAVRDETGRATRMAGSLTDVTARKHAEAQLLHDARHDALTGLPNRAFFVEHLQGALARQMRSPNQLFAVLFLDIDRFKTVNDSLGHARGDELLVQIARRLENCLRPGDVVARLGGDEFTIALHDLREPQDAAAVATRIQMVLALPFHLAREEVFASASIGIATSDGRYSAPEELLRDADTAMYRAKALGTGRHAMFQAAMHERAVAQLQLETDLRRALERGEFHLVYQPIVSLHTGALVGFEALARWHHPTRGVVLPSEFVPALEETGLILELCGWTLERACRDLRAWQDRHPEAASLTMAVNVSARQFHQCDLVAMVQGALDEAGLAAQCLRLEITESLMMENAGVAASVLRRLRALGVRVLMDDFGTGYSSLSYLHRFDFDTLKIDRSFVGAIGGEDADGEIVRTILVLASKLGKGVIAEGVETEAQERVLRERGCEFAQGFLYSVPLPAGAAEALIGGPSLVRKPFLATGSD